MTRTPRAAGSENRRYVTYALIYVTDRNDHVALKFRLDGKPLMALGKRGQPSDTGATRDIELPPRCAGPFNEPNLFENILPTRDRAHLILEKGPDHSVPHVQLRKA